MSGFPKNSANIRFPLVRQLTEITFAQTLTSFPVKISHDKIFYGDPPSERRSTRQEALGAGNGNQSLTSCYPPPGGVGGPEQTPECV
jgi:hypothetical protein